MTVGFFICLFLLVGMGIYAYKLSKGNKELMLLIEQFQNITPYEYDEVKESFLKFVSDSREWAFAYIEEVQNEILLISDDMKPAIEKLESKKRKTSEEKIIIAAYNKINNLLPEQGN
jgi:hypothetical protein